MFQNTLPTDAQSFSSASLCQDGKKKMTLKLINPENVTKRVHQLPENFEGLRSIIKAQM
jgi:hypothetical protein